MGTQGRYTLLGVYVSTDVADTLGDYVYEEAGVVDLDTYFDPDAASIPGGDPGAEATNALLESVLEDFAGLYDEANFAVVDDLNADSFELVYLAATPETVASLREQFQAASTIQQTDLRTIHTAIFEAALDSS